MATPIVRKDIKDASKLINIVLAATTAEEWADNITVVCKLPGPLENLGNVTLAELQASKLHTAIRSLHDLHGKLLLKAGPLTPLECAMAATFQSFHISTRLICVLDIWRSKWMVETPDSPVFSRCDPEGGVVASLADAEELVRLFEAELIQIPFQVDLYSLFFLLSQYNFIHHWRLWILPSLKRSGARKSLLESNPVGIYRQLAHVNRPKSPDLFVEIWSRSKDIRASIASSKRRCKCSAEGRTPHTCRRDVQVKRPKPMPKMGVALLESWVEEQKWTVLKPDPAQGDYLHVTKLKCGKKLVGLVIFNPYTDTALKTLCDNFELITERAATVGRSVSKFPYALQSGKALLMENPVIKEGRHVSLKPRASRLQGSGRRVPVGGAPGDTYSHYSWMNGDTKDDRARIFAHAHDVTCAVNLIRRQDNSTRSASNNVQVDDEEYEPGSGFGRYDLATFYAHNDSTSQHTDLDAAWSIATTYTKTVSPGLGGAFGWSEWGVVINSGPNTAWLFDSHEQHGKVHPVSVRESDGCEIPGWAEGYSDKGMVTVLRQKDYVWAKKMHSHQHSTPEFWKSFES